ncbi:hypothetical protein EDC01DRAFT_130680 [Geopyxis carbonaria]|nr:hypothetical protein EDC01DRAFT_130680 [Geopyxis carbonaria]
MSTRKRLVVFSGGSAANNLIEVFKTLCENRTRGLDFILPISDNGGSTSEILRVFGGPGIGDVRSRLIRLVPEDPDDEELVAIKCLLNHRLQSSNTEARIEWLELVEGTHQLWTGISSEKRELLRSFFNVVNLELIKRQRPTSSFNFQAASTGNLFLTGARIFFGSFESAIYLFRSITGVSENIHVIPAINSNFAHHIAAGLADGSTIVGQNQISHPSPVEPVSLPSEISAENENTASSSSSEEDGYTYSDGDLHEDANLPGSLAELRQRNIAFSKFDERELPSRIERVWYINPYGQEIRPPVNPKVLAAIEQAEAIMYSIGSLYTSLVPCLVLRNIRRALLSTPAKVPKILLLNGSHDRETGPGSSSFTASDFIRAIVRACSASSETPLTEWRKYVTHLIYLEGNGAPRVDIGELRMAGIEPIRVYGRRHPGGDGRGMLYDPVPLLQTLDAVMGRSGKSRPETRRNTVDGTTNTLDIR